MSKRNYHVIGFDHGEVVNYKITLKELFHVEQEENPFETNITLAEQIDAILDLEVGEAENVVLCRDHGDSLGTILRIQ